ncbi:MAG: gliding motility lipoprotein GldH [Tannerella sp.]|jgi:gliding motility-associated lipoprotein GldH|nr:gliding motility lipoprotein GldH [Tannerella sp.]
MHKHSLKNILAAIFIASCFFFSCSKDVIYNEFQSVQHKVWDKRYEYFFNFEINDNSLPYNIYLQLRNSNIYPYQNLWILVKELPPSGVFTKDTIEYMLADDFGKWTGNGITLFQNQLSLRKNYRFPDAGKYIISIRHGMRDDKLKGIEDIGLLIEKAK